MSELTKQYFDKQLGKLATKEELNKLATKEDLKKLATKEEIIKLDTKIGNLDTKIETEIANLARITKNGLEEIKRDLDVRKEVDQIKIQMSKVWSALNIKS